MIQFSWAPLGYYQLSAAEAEAAAKSPDDAITEAQEKEALGKMVAKRLRDTLVLFQLAQTLFA